MPHKTNGRFPWERDKKMKAAAYVNAGRKPWRGVGPA